MLIRHILYKQNDNCLLYICDNNNYNSTNNYVTILISRPSWNTTRAHISFSRGVYNVVQMEFIEPFGATFANNFGLSKY